MKAWAGAAVELSVLLVIVIIVCGLIKLAFGIDSNPGQTLGLVGLYRVLMLERDLKKRIKK